MVQLNYQLNYPTTLTDAFSDCALTLLVGRQEWHQPVKTEWWGAGVVICLE